MVCSSFVYQCYQDAANGNGNSSKANKKLKLQIENGDIKSVKQGALTQENDVQTLFDWYAQHAINNNLDSQVLAELEAYAGWLVNRTWNHTFKSLQILEALI